MAVPCKGPWKWGGIITQVPFLSNLTGPKRQSVFCGREGGKEQGLHGTDEEFD